MATQDTGGGICEAVAGAADAGSARGRVAADAGAAAQGAAAAAARREARAPALVGPHGAGREAVVLRIRFFLDNDSAVVVGKREERGVAIAPSRGAAAASRRVRSARPLRTLSARC